MKHNTLSIEVLALLALSVTFGTAACSSSPSQGVVADDGPSPAKAAPTSPDPVSTPAPAPGSPAPAEVCPTTLPLDATTAPWKPAVNLPGSCTTGEIDALRDYFESHPTATYPETKASVTNATCRGCLFAPDGTKWAPFVETAAGDLKYVNTAGCIAIVISDACGKTFSQLQDCTAAACADCADGDPTAIQDCAGAARKGACKAGMKNVGTTCGATINDALDICEKLSRKFSFEASARAQCVGLGGAGS